MANQEHPAILKQGVEAWNRWRTENPGVRPNLCRARLFGARLYRANLSRARLSGARLQRSDLCRADLRAADLSRVDLRRADLRAADLSRACVSRAELTWANLKWADLSGADLRWADLRAARLSTANLSGADLRWTALSSARLGGADLTGAYLVRANLVNATLGQADVSGARLGWGTLANVDLSRVKGLETVVHLGPSSIGIDTIYRSKGKIPEVFLRGAGVPEQFIEYARSLLAQPFQFYACFLCHSSKDRRFNERLHADLRAKGVRVWYFPEDARWGETVWGEIDRSIRIYDKLVVICSEHSLQSGPVLREIERALQREDREGKNVLFPIRIDDYLFDEWEHPRKADVLSKVVGDFRGWDRSADKYDRAFRRLLSALQADD